VSKTLLKMEIFRKSLPIHAILALKVIQGVNGAKNTSEESFPGHFNPEQFVLAGFWFTLGFISGIFVTFLGIGVKKILFDPIMADSPDWLKRLSKINAECLKRRQSIEFAEQKPETTMTVSRLSKIKAEKSCRRPGFFASAEPETTIKTTVSSKSRGRRSRTRVAISSYNCHCCFLAASTARPALIIAVKFR
jgi:hypothetical protein